MKGEGSGGEVKGREVKDWAGPETLSGQFPERMKHLLSSYCYRPPRFWLLR